MFSNPKTSDFEFSNSISFLQLPLSSRKNQQSNFISKFCIFRLNCFHLYSTSFWLGLGSDGHVPTLFKPFVKVFFCLNEPTVTNFSVSRFFVAQNWNSVVYDIFRYFLKLSFVNDLDFINGATGSDVFVQSISYKNSDKHQKKTLKNTKIRKKTSFLNHF